MSELDRLEVAVGECREMIREAHAATKDLRAAVREARQEMRVLAADEVAAHIQAEVSRQLAELGERTSEAVTAATQKVIAEFDRFGEALLGKETYWQKASGRRSAARRSLVAAWASRIISRHSPIAASSRSSSLTASSSLAGAARAARSRPATGPHTAVTSSSMASSAAPTSRAVAQLR